MSNHALGTARAPDGDRYARRRQEEARKEQEKRDKELKEKKDKEGIAPVRPRLLLCKHVCVCRDVFSTTSQGN